MGRVLLVRHATHDLVGKALAGRMPGVPLSAEGRAQAESLAGRLKGCGARRLLTSPLERCRETAAPIGAALGLACETDDGLIELDCGEWTGKTFEQLRDDPRWHAWNTERGRNAVPGGDSIGAVWSRAAKVLARFESHEAGPAVLVTHSDVIKVAVLGTLGASLDYHDRLEIDPASVTTLDLWPGGGKLVASNGHAPP